MGFGRSARSTITVDQTGEGRRPVGRTFSVPSVAATAKPCSAGKLAAERRDQGQVFARIAARLPRRLLAGDVSEQVAQGEAVLVAVVTPRRASTAKLPTRLLLTRGRL